jgi:glycosyltransferase involved in cell wall biosynthesis
LRPAFDPLYRERAFGSRGRAARLALRLGLSIFEAADRVAWRRYARIFCVSEEVRKRVLAARLAPPEKLEILHPSVGVAADEDREPEFQRFFLIPGRIMWTKNIELGIDAFRIFRRAHPDFRLVIAGVVDQKSKSYVERLRRLAEGEPGIEFRVSPGDDELKELYRTCYAVLFTAFNEDWGIVPVEAMASGKAVVATNRGGPTESIVHGLQGFLEDPEPSSFAARMAELASDASLARRLGAAGRERSRLFSWDAYARRIDEALDGLLSGSERSMSARTSPMEVDAR